MYWSFVVTLCLYATTPGKKYKIRPEYLTFVDVLHTLV